ncbi:MAG: hypothetical protein FJZ92_03610 [Chloroflexi bacterium]|nr:hypothetical protein [Chloroflexota bacterium]
MPRLFRPPYLFVFAGFMIGVLAGEFVLATEPAFFGWLFGAGAGTTGGALAAAIASGQPIVSGPAPSRHDRWPEADDEEAERAVPRLLDGLPPRRDARGEGPSGGPAERER